MSTYRTRDSASRGAATRKRIVRKKTRQKHVRRRQPLDINLSIWHTLTDRLTLRETGELVRSLARARSSRRPNREQRLLMAMLIRDQQPEVAS